MALTRPTIILRPWAENGNKNTIPVGSQIGTTDGAASLNDGFPPLTMAPVASGGVPPSGLDMNGILNLISGNVRFANAGGLPRFSSALATEIGGYPVGVVLQDDSGANSYINILDGNTTNFNSTPAAIGVSWMPYCGSGFLNSRPGHTYTANDWAWLDKTSGLIVQWGILGSILLNGGVIGSFPLAFPNDCFVFVGSPAGTTHSSTSNNFAVEILSNTQYKLWCWGTAANYSVRWIAIGN